MPQTRVMLADDHVFIMDAVQKIIEPSCEVIGMFSDGEALVIAAETLEPDVIIADISMPKMNGLRACRIIKKVLPKTKVIFLTANREAETAGEAFRAGASGYVLKTSTASELLIAIKDVLRGGYYVAPSLTEGMIGSFVQNLKAMTGPRPLTLRQKEVLQLLMEGRPMKQVANMLNITIGTVAFHKYKMMEILNLQSSAELISYGTRNRMESNIV